MTASRSFSGFPDLPAELRLAIWEEATVGPSMHILDVCYPTPRGNDRSRRAFREANCDISRNAKIRWWKYENVAFLDRLESDESNEPPTHGHQYTWCAAHDPSMYHQRQSQRLSCKEAASAAVIRTKNVNTVYLPGCRRKFDYDNDKDVLFLRFASEASISTARTGASVRQPSSISGLADVLGTVWSKEMSLTVWHARHIAIDVEATLTPLYLVEMSHLASCIQKGLVVLYLIVRFPGYGKSREADILGLSPAILRRRGRLFRLLHGMHLKENLERQPDVIRGLGKTYREIFNFESMSWNESHPAFVFACLVSEAIRRCQYGQGAEEFKGVRVLAVEDDDS